MEDFSKVTAQFTPMIHQIIRSLSIYKNKDDFFQIGLAALWEAQKNYQEEKGKFSSYAYTVIKGRMINELKREKRFEENIRLSGLSGDELGKAAVYQDVYFTSDHLANWAEGLTVNQKRWLFHTLQDYSQLEIAKHYHVTAAAVKSWRKSALKKLKEKAELFR